MAYDGSVQALNDFREDGEAARGRGVAAADEDAVCTFGPGHLGSVDGFLDVAAVEVDFSANWKVIERTGKAEDIPEERAGCGDLIDVEAGVYERDCSKDVIP